MGKSASTVGATARRQALARPYETNKRSCNPDDTRRFVMNFVTNNASYGRLTGGLIAAWFIFALSASALHLFKTDPDVPPPALGLAVLVPIVVFLLWFGTSAGFRTFALSLNPRTLTFVHSWRIAGFTFLALYAAGLLPGVFALPAGWGDIAIGATAPLVGLKLANFSHRRGFIFWQILGIFDLVTAVTVGTAGRVVSANEVAYALATGSRHGLC